MAKKGGSCGCRSRRRRGGKTGLAKTVMKAAVPFGLLALQRSYGKRKRSGKRSRRRTRKRR